MLERARTSLRLRARDARDRIGGRGDPLVPPRRLQLAGHGDFAVTGDEILGQLRELAGLEPRHRVLDVGCGTGRTARPLARFLSAEGGYEGFDVDRAAIGWCRRRYAHRRPDFGFKVADLYDRRFNPAGAHAAGEFRFPYDDAAFDVAVATSVFTHLLEDEATRYLAESARVLRPSGRLLATFFLLDDESRRRIAAGEAGLPFLDPDAHVAVVSDDLPEEAVAYDTGWVRDHATRAGLAVTAVRPGTWSGREDGMAFQDVVVCARST